MTSYVFSIDMSKIRARYISIMLCPIFLIQNQAAVLLEDKEMCFLGGVVEKEFLRVIMVVGMYLPLL